MPHRSPLIVVAPDSLKGSCTAADASRAIARGIRAAFSGRGRGVRIVELPMADGGEGTVKALTAEWGGTIMITSCSDALGRPRVASFGLDPDRRVAIIEAAEANGLPHVTDRPLAPLDADTFGVGELVLSALEEGAKEILLCLGGSATNDGGAGMLRALGAQLLDAAGNKVPPGARGLGSLASIDLDGLDPRAASARWRIACDVDNPLVGPRGAAAVFGPQKGADASEVEAIDAGLWRLGAVLAEVSGQDPAPLIATPGMGAAGGLALGPVALFDADLTPGAQLVAGAMGLERVLDRADLVITAEGRLDAQSLDGKVVSQIVANTPTSVPVIVLAGSVALTGPECRAAGITAAFSIAQGPATLAELQTDAAHLLEETSSHVGGVLAGLLRPVR